jgi:hypothetical protein
MPCSALVWPQSDMALGRDITLYRCHNFRTWHAFPIQLTYLLRITTCREYYGGAGRKVCHTAFAGVTLECPVAYAVAVFCLAELKAVRHALRQSTSVHSASSAVARTRPTKQKNNASAAEDAGWSHIRLSGLDI